jgi:trans-2,3-dihydro-3-hydroxyanthranilate isomerase
MKLKFHTLDVFTAEPFTGNGLAVVLDADGLSDQRMQEIAREFNLSETIFVQRPEDETHTAKVRIFMPAGELPFAGHPTIGCAVLLASLKYKSGCSFDTDILLEEKVGLVPVKVSRIGDAPRAIFVAPKLPQKIGKAPSNSKIARGLGLDEDRIGFSSHRPGVFAAGNPFLFVPVGNLEALARARATEPHWSEMLKEAGAFSAYIYTPAGARPDTSFRARLYAPNEGIPEDPATGSAAATFPGQIHFHESLEDGRHRWQIEQGYEMGRPSQIAVEAEISGGSITVVRVGGQAVHVSEGTIEF